MSNVNAGAHKPSLDNMTPSQIRVLCEELLYTMDTDQRWKIARKLPGIYKMACGPLPDTLLEQTANQLAHEYNEVEPEPLRKVHSDDVYEALKKVGL